MENHQRNHQQVQKLLKISLLTLKYSLKAPKLKLPLCPVFNVHQIFNLKVTSYQTQSPTLVEMMKNLPNLTNGCWTKISKVKKKSHRLTNSLQGQEIFHKMLLMDPHNQS
ncbi:hypothetical protein MTP99_018626 [Tenebrio molitor]|nr:hypothetical protein MTP99_018626 [Tenebrio molitor]